LSNEVARIVEKCRVTTDDPRPAVASSRVWTVRTTTPPRRISGVIVMVSRSPAASTARVSATGTPADDGATTGGAGRGGGSLVHPAATGISRSPTIAVLRTSAA
jgi:hypothetical protein